MKLLPPVKPRRKSRGRFHHGDLRAAAIAVAVREVEAHGHAALTLERIARRLGVTRPALYAHFADRAALLQEVAQQGYEGFEAAMTDAFLASEADPWAALLATGRAYVQFAVANPGWFRLQFSTSPADLPTPDLTRAPPRYAIGLHSVLHDQLGRGDARVGTAYHGLWGVAHGLAWLTISGVFADRDALAYVDEVLAQHLAGLRGLAEGTPK